MVSSDTGGGVPARDFDPMPRDLSRSDFRVLWNALLALRLILDADRLRAQGSVVMLGGRQLFGTR